MAKYDLNDPYDIDRLKFDFECYSSEDWENYIEYAKEKKFGYDKIGVLIAANRDGRSRRHTNKQKMFALSLVEMLDALKEDEVKNDKANELFEDASFELPPSNLTLRVAWHDNKWNGSICKDPANNTYCNGFHSLLSDRIRKRKEDNIQNEIDNANKSLNEIDYLPPCFWSINLFGKDPVKVSHDNPAASKLDNIEEELKERSMYSWPFAVSFTRTPKEVDKFHRQLHAYALTLVHDQAMAQDIVQNVFFKTWKSRKKLNAQFSIQGFLYKCVYNEFINTYQKNKRVMILNQQYFQSLQEVVNSYEDNELEKLIELLNREIKKLPPKCQAVFVLSKKEGLTNYEIAEYLNISIKTVEAQITKAFGILRKKLA
ncbi:sigma-70 family RNA polymerase sigma factor [Flavobacteriaceae bacterium XHP0103]|uniref:sigma-70 family RNA polymerase sigma factor n=1 Tax=Marixanthotalea marina TaxID=2844359 RepID=UPI002989DFAD|nr:sigma-70 family RNA polymerase sigma factor [Marixanthotalea marina]MBU3821448.1 sigma-70 family RNA polymerase sigma factor [Marixanthotalea marina]